MEMAGLLCFKAGVPLAPCIETSLYGLSMAFEGCFTPTEVAVLIGNLDKEPARGHPEVLNLCYFPHDDTNMTVSIVLCSCLR